MVGMIILLHNCEGSLNTWTDKYSGLRYLKRLSEKIMFYGIRAIGKSEYLHALAL